MSKRRNGLRASVRAAAASAPTPATPLQDDGPAVEDRERDRGPGFHDDHLHAPDGRVYRSHTDRVDASRAQGLLASGALMAVDDCGCRGYCGLDWPDDAERRDLARRPPRLSRRGFGWFEEWHTDTGRRLLVQYGDVRWP